MKLSDAQNNFISALLRRGIINDESSASCWFKPNGKVEMFLEEETNLHPSNVHGLSVTLETRIEQGDDFEKLKNNDRKKYDQFTKSIKENGDDSNFELNSYSNFVFNLCFTAIDNNSIKYQSSWHLDYEPLSKYPYLNEPKVYHPLFHLHYGGTTMRSIYQDLNAHRDILDKDNSYYSIFEELKSIVKDDKISEIIDDLLLKRAENYEEIEKHLHTFGGEMISYIPLYMIAPRIPFPPMDIYLGIDFIISNFWPKNKYKELLREDNYCNMIKQSREKLNWDNYFNSITSYWNKKAYKIRPEMLIPSLIIK